jgi:Transposase Tn5 dimerisation domain
LAHCTPHAPGAQLFEADEYKAAYILNHEKLPTKPPTLNEVVRWWHDWVVFGAQK